MNCDLPILNGENATKHIRHILQGAGISLQNQPSIIAITGQKQKEFSKKAIKNGFDQVLTKPLHIREFGELLLKKKYIDRIPLNLGKKSDDGY